MHTAFGRVKQSIVELPGALILPAWIAGLLVVLIGFTSSLVLVVPAAEAAHLSPQQLGSWVWAISVGSGISALILSLWYKQPVLTAWSTPALALLGTSLAHYRLSEAVGAYIIAGVAITLLGVSGLFERVIRVIPQPVAMAVLGGLLLKYGLALFTGLVANPTIVAVIIAVFLLLRRIKARAPMAGALLAGFGMAWALGQLNLAGVRLELATPLFVWPEFTLNALLGLALPLFVLALASQNLPGFAVMRAAGYTPPVNGSLIVTGALSVLLAPALNHGLTLAAITAAICNSPDAHPDPERRYGAAVVAGFFYIVLGLFGFTLIGLLTALPREVVAALAGLALSGTILNCLTGSFTNPDHRDSALWALLVTASDVHIFGIGSAFWGFVAGVLVHVLLERRALSDKMTG